MYSVQTNIWATSILKFKAALFKYINLPNIESFPINFRVRVTYVIEWAKQFSW